MSDTQIDITLRSSASGETAARFSPEEAVHGSVQITPENDLNCRHVYARLHWRTEGRGDEDKQVVAEQDLYQGELRAGLPRQFGFSLRLPDQPWSYAGQLVRIVWELEVTLDIALARDPRASVPIVMRPMVT
ncbi:MAG: hypothetical protein PVF85_00475 [Anaerolineales bacterium]|jgi:hypothetical protein